MFSYTEAMGIVVSSGNYSPCLSIHGDNLQWKMK